MSSFRSRNRPSFSLINYSLGALIAVVGISISLAQTSPWPFPARRDATVNPNNVTVAFWNIRWFPGGRPNAYKGEQVKQIRAVQSEIVRLNADVIGFEEVRDWANAGVAAQPLNGFKVDVCSNFPPREGQSETQNVAIVSRLEPMSAWYELWKPGAAITPPRGFAFAAYQLAPKKLLLVYAVHLKSNRGEAVEDIAIREESLRQLAAHMQDMNKAYSPVGAITWVVGGDFNTAPDDPRFKAEKTTQTLVSLGLKWCWENIPMSNRITMPSEGRYPAACFDQIYYRGATLRKAEVIQTPEVASDHRPVRAELSVP